MRVGSVSMNAWGLLLVELWFCLGFFLVGGASGLLFWGWEFFKTFSLLATGPVSLFLSYLKLFKCLLLVPSLSFSLTYRINTLVRSVLP